MAGERRCGLWRLLYAEKLKSKEEDRGSVTGGRTKYKEERGREKARESDQTKRQRG